MTAARISTVLPGAADVPVAWHEISGQDACGRSSAPLTATTLLVVLVGLWLPYSRFAGPLGFVRLSAGFYAFLAAAVVTYLLFVQVIRARLVRRLNL